MPWQNDNKVCFIWMEGALFGEVAMNLELRLSVEDSPNSAGVAIDGYRWSGRADSCWTSISGPAGVASSR